MLLTRWNRTPSHPIQALSQDLERMLGGFVDAGEAQARHVSPPVAIWETDAGFEVDVEVPGVPADDLDVSVHGNRVSVKGERKPVTREDATALRQEWGAYKFERTFELPVDIDAAGLEAKLDHGILHLKLQKSPGHKPQKVKVLPA